MSCQCFGALLPNRRSTPFVALALLQDDLPLHKFVVACAPPKEQPLLQEQFDDLMTSATKPRWWNFIQSWVVTATATEFDDYLKPLHHPVFANRVKGILAPYFKPGVATLFLPDGPCDRLCACAVACVGVTDSRVRCQC